MGNRQAPGDSPGKDDQVVDGAVQRKGGWSRSSGRKKEEEEDGGGGGVKEDGKKTKKSLKSDKKEVKEKEEKVKEKEKEKEDKKDKKKKEKDGAKTNSVEPNKEAVRKIKPMGRLSASFTAGDGKRSSSSSSAAGGRGGRASAFPAVDDKRGGVATDGIGSRSAAAPGEVKIYRSYSNLVDSGARRDPRFVDGPDMAAVKIYRKSPETLLSPSQRTMSLPKGFGRSKSAVTPRTGNGGFAAPRTPDHFLERTWDASTFNKRASTPTMRSSTMPRLTSTSSAGYRVTKDDFSETATIQRKLKQFESQLVKSLVQKFALQNPEFQATSIPVAIRPGRPSQVVTLFDFLTNRDGAAESLGERSEVGELVLCIPPAFLSGMEHFRRRERTVDREQWPSLARDLVTCVAAEAAVEISRMFEYQIALLSGDTSTNLLADHCADRVVSFVLHDLQTPRFDRNTVVQGAVRGKATSSSARPVSPVYISVIIGMKELKWNLFEIFDRPGLRKDVLLVHETIPAPGDDDRCPWKFFTSPSSDPMLYGYRGQLIEWDFVQGVFRLNGFDEAFFAEEMSWRYDDFHRLYPTYRRLCGSRAMKRYYTEQARSDGPPVRLDRYLQQSVQGVAYSRDVIQPVYRPLELFTLAALDRIDLSSADIPRVLLPKNTVASGIAASDRLSATPSYGRESCYSTDDAVFREPSRSPGVAVYGEPSRSPGVAMFNEPSRSPGVSVILESPRSTGGAIYSEPSRSPGVAVIREPPRSTSSAIYNEPSHSPGVAVYRAPPRSPGVAMFNEPSHSPGVAVYRPPPRSPGAAIYSEPSRSPGVAVIREPLRSMSSATHNEPSRSPGVVVYKEPSRSPGFATFNEPSRSPGILVIREPPRSQGGAIYSEPSRSPGVAVFRAAARSPGGADIGEPDALFRQPPRSPVVARVNGLPGQPRLQSTIVIEEVSVHTHRASHV